MPYGYKSSSLTTVLVDAWKICLRLSLRKRASPFFIRCLVVKGPLKAMSSEVPRVGVGVFVLNSEGKFVMGTRKGSLGSGTVALPGGHLDFGESFEECACREVKEETDLDIANVRFLTAVNSVLKKEKKQYVTIFMVGHVREQSKALKLMEPEKCEGWFWVDWGEMRSWALSELSENGIQMEDNGANGAHTPLAAGNELFQPLVNLLRDRPEAVPLRASRTENART